MAAIDVEARSAGHTLERSLIGAGLVAAASFEATNGRSHALLAGAIAALALYLLRSHQLPGSASRLTRGLEAAADFLAVAALAALCDPTGVLWRAPTSLENLFTLTPSGAGTASFLYLTGAITLVGRSPLAVRGALFLLPFIFSLLISLGSPVAVELGA